MKKISKAMIILLALLSLAACGNDSEKKSTAEISLNAAEETALADAGLTLADVDFIKSKTGQSDGVSVFHVEFYADGMKYGYEIHAGTGAVYSRSREPYSGQGAADSTDPAGGTADGAPGSTSPADGTGAADGAPGSTSPVGGTGTADGAPGTQQSQNGGAQITLDAAKETALADAGLTAADVTFTEAYLDYEDGIAVYDIEFYTATHEYEYEISAASGAIYSRSEEPFGTDRHWDWDSHHDEDWYHNHGWSPDSAWTAENDIGMEAAKNAALSHAGFLSSEVRFTKAEFDWDDGIAVYEIEFYKGAREYEYTINASDGTILGYDMDP